MLLQDAQSEGAALTGRKWSEKEYLIVLYQYYKHKTEAQHADTPFVRDLSRMLGRTPHSILYRLQNFASIDPQETDPRRKGKGHISEFGSRLFHEWTAKLETLKDTAEVLVRDTQSEAEPNLFTPLPTRIPAAFKDRYELLDEIGAGGFGQVYSCLDTKLPMEEAERALKIVHYVKTYNEECIHRFRTEIRALKAVTHPHVIRIYDDNLDTERNDPAFVMDLAECDLTTYLGRISAAKNGSAIRPILPIGEAQGILFSVLDGTKALHQNSPQIIHRDINPANILKLFDGRWVIADFSLAKFVPAAPVSTVFATGTRVGMGTSHYTAPESWKSLKETDEKSDIFSLGWLLWDLFSTEGPYPCQVPSGLQTDIEAVFWKATQHDKTKRYQAIQDFEKDLRNCFEACESFIGASL